jgi:hypothetical protein
MRADSATVARVWSRNTTTKIVDRAAAKAATGASTPSVRRRVPITPNTAREPTSSGARAIRPCGASVTLNTATRTAIAAGTSRRVAIAFSTRAQAASVPKAISGSGRRPLLNGSQAARNTAPAVHTATRSRDSRRPSRGSTQRLRISQVPSPASVAGSRIQIPAVLTEARCASTDWYQSNGASVVPKKR